MDSSIGGGGTVAAVDGGGDGWLLLTRGWGQAVEFDARGKVDALVIWSEVIHVSPRIIIVGSGYFTGVFGRNA